MILQVTSFGRGYFIYTQVDVFSFGIVLWEILTGEEPYANMHYGAIIGKLLLSFFIHARILFLPTRLCTIRNRLGPYFPNLKKGMLSKADFTICGSRNQAHLF